MTGVARGGMRNAGRSKERGVMLLEALLAVTIFAIGVITLGRCVSNCIAAERLKEEDALARRALENRWAEIESGAVPLTDSSTEDLKAPFAGMKMKMTSVPVKKRNEKDEKIEGISAVTLEVTWESDQEEQTKELIFYVYPRQK
jgi:Tfp pilus assembly protein PilV